MQVQGHLSPLKGISLCGKKQICGLRVKNKNKIWASPSWKLESWSKSQYELLPGLFVISSMLISTFCSKYHVVNASSNCSAFFFIGIFLSRCAMEIDSLWCYFRRTSLAKTAGVCNNALSFSTCFPLFQKMYTSTLINNPLGFCRECKPWLLNRTSHVSLLRNKA